MNLAKLIYQRLMVELDNKKHQQKVRKKAEDRKREEQAALREIFERNARKDKDD